MKESIKSTMRVVVARSLAEALISGFDECKEDDLELTQLQKIKMTEMSIMTYHSSIKDLSVVLDTTELIQKIKVDRESPA